jgi:hypothetical protein
VRLTALVALLAACSSVPSPDCALERLGGRDGRVSYDDPGQPWPCGQAPADASGCTLVSEVCSVPIVWDCDGLRVELSSDTLTVRQG